MMIGMKPEQEDPFDPMCDVDEVDQERGDMSACAPPESK